MARISELLDRQSENERFEDLEDAVVEAARAGEIHLYMDIKPEFPDTPRNWELELELAFCRAEAARRD